MATTFSKRLRRRLLLGLGLPLGSGLLRLVCASLRLERDPGLDHLLERLEAGERFVLAGWHGDILTYYAGLPLIRRFGTVRLLVSRSRDGEYISRILRGAGVEPFRGSSSKGGDTAFREMARAMGPRDIALFPVDGPRGPRGRSKLGALRLARRCGLPVLPVAGDFVPRRRAGSWDRMKIPLPFARLRFRVGEALEVPADADRETLEALRAELDRRLAELERTLDHATP